MANRLQTPRSLDELDVRLLDAKLRVPSTRPHAVTRFVLIGRGRASGCRVVGLTAPAGYGKTVFLAEWAQSEARRVVWVSLDRLDDDPARLLSLLAHAYGRIDPESADRLVGLVGLGTSLLGQAAPRLAAVFGASPVPFVLILDDLHELQSPTCHDVLGVVVEGLPRGSQLVTASRFEQPHLPRLRAAGDAVEFVAADLALDATGAQQIFSSVQIELSPKLAADMAERTEGWPVGLYLAALLSRESGGRVEVPTGADRYVADYLYAEALRRQPEQSQQFLRRTAVLDQLCGPLCEAVAGSTGAADQLIRLEAAGLFVVPLDRRREWYRYHALFREFLVAELQRHEPDIAETLHLRAADWYESNGSPTQAIEHLLLTSDADRAARAIARAVPLMHESGGLAANIRWVSTLGDAAVERYPPLAVSVAWHGVINGDPLKAERWAAFVETAVFDEVPVGGAVSFESDQAALRALMCAHGPERMLTDALFGLEQETKSWSPWRDNRFWLLAEAHLLNGTIEEARQFFAEASSSAAAMKHTTVRIGAESQLAMLAMDDGNWDEATERVRLALVLADNPSFEGYVECGLAFLAAARLALHCGDMKTARVEVTRAMRMRPLATHVVPFVAVRLRLGLAKLHFALSDAVAARHLLQEIDDILRRRPALGTLVDEIDEFKQHMGSSASSAIGPAPLSPAELRVLPYLQTHLTLGAIAERLFVSRHTVRSQVASIYRKLGASSRPDAVEVATAIGLLGG